MKSYKNHWFFGHTTPFALFEVLASTGKSHRAEFVPNTWTKFSYGPTLYTFGPIFGFLCLSKLSNVDEFYNTKSTWNLKNEIITQ